MTKEQTWRVIGLLIALQWALVLLIWQAPYQP